MQKMTLTNALNVKHLHMVRPFPKRLFGSQMFTNVHFKNLLNYKFKPNAKVIGTMRISLVHIKSKVALETTQSMRSKLST